MAALPVASNMHTWAGCSEAVPPQAGSCGRCRGDLGVAGRVCAHCKLDTNVLAHEMRLYAVHTRALAAGSVVTAEEALRQVPALPCPALLQSGQCQAPCWLVTLSVACSPAGAASMLRHGFAEVPAAFQGLGWLATQVAAPRRAG